MPMILSYANNRINRKLRLSSTKAGQHWIDQQSYSLLNSSMVLHFASGLSQVKVPSGFLLDRCMVLAFPKCPDLPRGYYLLVFYK